MSARIGAAIGQPRCDPLLRLLRLATPLRGRLLVAAVAGALATICGVALLAVSGFLLARASQHPGIAALAIAVVAVRGLSVGRGVFRYAERLASHDVAFRVLARTRVAIWRKLETLAPAGLPAFRSADLLSRLVGDVDATQDLFIRGIAPPIAAGLAGAAAVGACLTLLGRAGMLLAAGLLAGGILVPIIALRAARTSARLSANARGEISHGFNDILVGAADLQAFGAAESALERVELANRQIKKLDRRSASAAGMGVGLASLTAGLTLWGVLLLGVAAVGSGALSRVPLAVLALTALAAFEAVTTLPAAAVQLSHARTAATRIAEVMDAPRPVTDPPDPRPLPRAGTRGVSVRLRDARVRYRPRRPARDRRRRPGPHAGQASRTGRTARGRQVDDRGCSASLPQSHRRLGHPGGARPGQLSRGRRAIDDRRLRARPAPVQRQHRREPQARGARRDRRRARCS